MKVLNDLLQLNLGYILRNIRLEPSGSEKLIRNFSSPLSPALY